MNKTIELMQVECRLGNRLQAELLAAELDEYITSLIDRIAALENAQPYIGPGHNDVYGKII